MSNILKSITVFCGSSPGLDPEFTTQARLVGQKMAAHNIELIYGGARVGLMGTVADGVLEAGGSVTGVIPHFLKTKEIAHEGLSQLISVDSMHERKMKMNELCDGVIALPGGFGTLEELFEMLTWAQLGLHRKPIGLLNVNGYYDALLTFIQHMVDKGLLKAHYQEMLLADTTVAGLLAKMQDYKAPEVEKWLEKEDT